MRLKIVQSESMPGKLSIRAWCPVRKRWSATAIREQLTAEFKEGDEVVVTLSKALAWGEEST
jgi:hypothetical protein